MLNKGDFHIHSNASDGDLSPREIIIEAKQRGVDIISISDHNTTAGIKEAAEAGSQYGVSVVPAVEVSARYKNEKVHILGYFKNSKYNDGTFQEVLNLIKSRNAKNARSILNLINPDASEKYLSVSEVIYLLRSYDAAVVLAHPVRIEGKYITDILNFPFDGIEAKYCTNSFLDSFYFMAAAISRFSFYTAGSDFHTNLRKDIKHSPIGEPCLDGKEIDNFLRKSGVMLLC
ncbi:MAG: PHP domain-containing protein [Bacillota bacterium]|nr:PHP domain-containing protein [Bacillota bacterium]